MMGNIQENAFRRLYKWLKDECNRFENPAPTFTPLMKDALETLKDRPILITYCLEEIARVRLKFVTQSFLISLTQGGPSGTPRPIEIHAHDPIRYCGDMLAWVHQTVASESEIISSFISKEADQAQIQKALDSIFDGISNHFSVKKKLIL